MAISTSSVKSILGNEYDSVEDSDLAEFVSAAELVVTEDLAGVSLSISRRELITKYLAAHFAVLTLERGGLVRQEIGESSDTYKEGSNTQMGYLMTRFGQQAIALDTSGTLATNATPKQKAEFRVVTPSTSAQYGAATNYLTSDGGNADTSPN